MTRLIRAKSICKCSLLALTEGQQYGVSVEVPGGGERPQTHKQSFWGVISTTLPLKLGEKYWTPNTFALSGQGALLTQGSRETLLRMRGGTGSPQTEQPWIDSAVPGKTSKDKGQAILQDGRGAYTPFSDRNFTARLSQNLLVSSLCPE